MFRGDVKTWSFKKFCSGRNLGILQICVCFVGGEVGNSQKLGEQFGNLGLVATAGQKASMAFPFFGGCVDYMSVFRAYETNTTLNKRVR